MIYNIKIINKLLFNNIEIILNEDKWIMISKNNEPTIHFIIEHPTLIQAISNFLN